jgi:hypothetical protein
MPARIDQINQIAGFPEKVKNVPPNYPSEPGPGKISLLWQYNHENLWHRFSPYTYGDNVFGLFRNKQPFIYRYPDEGQDSTFNQLPAAVKTLASAGNITQGTLDDVVRVSKLLVTSPEGALYNIKQFTLQRLNPFDETRVYNPLSPVLATISGMTFGIGDRPRRHIEGGILTGLLNSATSAVGINFQSQFNKPASTAGDTTSLPSANIHEGKGMLRGKTAADAQARLTSKWPNSPSTAVVSSGFGSLLSKAVSSFLDSAKNSLSAFFGDTKKSSGKYRADEGGYKLMRISKGKLDSYDKWGAPVPLLVKYFPGSLYKKDDTDNTTVQIIFPLHTKYGTDRKAKTNFEDRTDKHILLAAEQLQAVITGLKKNSTYQTLTNTYSKLLASGELSAVGYARLNRTVPSVKGTPKTHYGVTAEYYTTFGVPKTVDKSTSADNLRMATTFTSDALNRVGVIRKDRKFDASKEYPNYTEYKPYEDDLVAFFFYDVVNQKYIPFRATVKGISEGNTAFWDELRFIGRADQLYSYNGFSRTLSFTFNVVVSSLSELLPTWQKINYMASCVKPSNYTAGAKFGDNRYSRFIVPPMFMVTIGDMYKFQPIVITSINVNIPDDASWETLNEVNSKRWSYLNGIIKAPSVGKNYAQLPKEAEIAITCNLLEKERAIVGGSHFGHAPVSDDDSNVFITGNEPYLPNVTSFGAGMVTFTENEVVANSRWEARRTEATNRPGGLIGTPLQQ